MNTITQKIINISNAEYLNALSKWGMKAIIHRRTLEYCVTDAKTPLLYINIVYGKPITKHKHYKSDR